MRVIEPSYRILEIPEQTHHDEVLKFIEQIGRVCYKSEDHITEESAHTFCEKMRDSKHWAMLEHYRFSFFCSMQAYAEIKDSIKYPAEDDLEFPMKYQYLITSINRDRPKGRECLITCSATALNYLVATKTIRQKKQHIINELFDYMMERYPELMCVPASWEKPLPMHPIVMASRSQLANLVEREGAIHNWMSVWFTISRGTTHEAVRHRNHVSYAQESTRYCNYSKGKFSNEITVIVPPDVDLQSPLGQAFMQGAEDAEDAYFRMLKEGVTAQIARELLPHAVKADLVVTAPFQEWKHIFAMRCPRSAHPAMQQIMRPLLHTVLNGSAPTARLWNGCAYLLEG